MSLPIPAAPTPTPLAQSPLTASSDTYRVQLDAFEGPMDLLLFLIRKNEVDVHNIPISTITEQFIHHLHDLQLHDPARIDIDTAGEFLVMAATLMEIKSRMLMPTPLSPGTNAGGTEAGATPERPADPRAELVRQLLEYKRYRDAADALEHRGDEWRRRVPVSPIGLDASALEAAINEAREVELEDLELIDLVEAFRRIAETVNFDRLGEHQVTYDDTPLELHAEDILDRLRTQASRPESAAQQDAELPLAQIFEGRTRSQMVGLFIAMLELVRRRAIAFRQERVDQASNNHVALGQIFVRIRPPSSEPSTETDSSSQSLESQAGS
jgi:segregation and condensation protein A